MINLDTPSSKSFFYVGMQSLGNSLYLKLLFLVRIVTSELKISESHVCFHKKEKLKT